MNPTERTLQSTKRVPTIREEDEEHAYRRISGVSRSVSDQLDANERRMTEVRTAPVDFPRMIHDAVRQTALHREGKLLLQLPDGVFVQGPADDLREMIASLAEYVSSGS